MSCERHREERTLVGQSRQRHIVLSWSEASLELRAGTNETVNL